MRSRIISRLTARSVAARLDTIYRTRVDTITRRDTVLFATAPDADQVILRVQFVTARAEILPESRVVLDTVAAAIVATPNSRWQVEGHTDSVGTDADNQVLSQARAQAVVDYLVSRGVMRSIMSVQLRRIPPLPAVPNR